MSKVKSSDPFAKVRAATLAHRAKHGCGAWPYDNGPLLGVMAAAVEAKRILELGTALGYTSLSFANGASKAKVDTIERDPEHVRLARANIAAAGMDRRINVHEGDFAKVLPTLDAAMTSRSSTAIPRCLRCTRRCASCCGSAAC